MLQLKSFCFGPFQENTYLLYEENKHAWIIDPGNSNNKENTQLKNYIEEQGLKLERLLLTHGHIDHIMGNRFIFDTYGLLPEVHEADLFFIDNLMKSATLYGLHCEPSPTPEKYLQEGDRLFLGTHAFDCFHTPGHSPGSISFYQAENNFILSGDVLFYGSVGRSDLPLGDHDTLIASIKNKLMKLPDDTVVYSGHGQSTTIGAERHYNPFIQ